MIINQKSWHYALYKVWNSSNDPTDICYYTRHVIFGFLFSLLLVVVGVIVGCMVIEPALSIVLWLLGSHSFQTFFGGEMGEVLWMVDTIVFLLVTIFVGCTWVENAIKARKARKELQVYVAQPSFLKEAYRSWKKKYCIRVEFKKAE